ncbi:MAG: S8 family serine peptidase [Flavitalea sp.]
MKKYYLLISLIILTAWVKAQSSLQLVKFTNKSGSVYSLAQPSAFLSAKSIQRRIKQKILIDSTDLPVNPAYLEGIKKIPGVRLHNVSKWLNQVMVEVADSSALQQINALPFVAHEKTKQIKTIITSADPFEQKFKETFGTLPDSLVSYKPRSSTRASGAADDLINYGSSYNQVHIHEGEYLHNLGFRGEGMTIAMLDAGFNSYLTNAALEPARSAGRIKGEYDFVNNEFSVNEDNTHGFFCLSILTSDLPGVMVGTAPRANYYLYRTENVASESIAEEQNWATAAEKADSVGVDMISSSLGYINFDDPLMNHSYAQRDGNTALITNAADLAAKKGNGTSFSNPNVAGLIACLWQAFSEFTNMEIIDAVQKSSDKYNNPDERYGYGLPNFHTAYNILQQKREANLQHILNPGWIKAFKMPFDKTFTVLLRAPASGNASFQILDAAGRLLQKKSMIIQQDNYYYIDFAPPVTAAGIYYLHYDDGKNKTVLKLTKL